MNIAGGQFPIGLATPGWPLGVMPNGIVTYVANIVPHLRARGHPVALLAGTAGPGPHDLPVYDAEAAWRHRSALARVLHSVQYRLAPGQDTQAQWQSLSGVARRMVAEQGVRIIEMEESFGIAGRLQRAVQVPVVVRLHGPWFLNGAALGAPRDEAFRRRVELEGEAIGRAVAISAPSQNVLDEVRRHYAMPLAQAVVVPNPLPAVPESDRWRLEACDPHRVLFVGRFDRHKGGDLALEAFARVLREFPEARFSFVGPDRGFCDDAGRVWSLPEFVQARLPGAVESGALELVGPQPFQAIGARRRRALVTIVSSRYETFAYTAGEALAHGCPLVAADAGGIPEIVKEGVTGLLHRAGDADHLAARILELLRDPVRAASLGSAGARDSERLRPEAVVPLILDHYQHVLRG